MATTGALKRTKSQGRSFAATWRNGVVATATKGRLNPRLMDHLALVVASLLLVLVTLFTASAAGQPTLTELLNAT